MARLVLPGLHGQEPAMVCRVPVGEEDLCLKPFWPGEEHAFQKHVGECAKRHAEMIHAQSPKQRMPWGDPEMWDPEYEAHMGKVGRRMLAEGRLETRPNEV